MCLDHGRKLELCTSGLSPTVYMNVIHCQVSAEHKQIEERCGQYQSFALLLPLRIALLLVKQNLLTRSMLEKTEKEEKALVTSQEAENSANQRHLHQNV